MILPDTDINGADRVGERLRATIAAAGLAQEAIPLAARILSVFDSFDAMTSRRPYREPLTIEQARAELRHCAGQQYDPQVVQAFVRVLDERARELVIVENKADVLRQIPQQMDLNRVT